MLYLDSYALSLDSYHLDQYHIPSSSDSYQQSSLPHGLHTASIGSAWGALPNHERIVEDNFFRVLQVLCSSIGPLSIAGSIAGSIAISTLPAQLCCR